MAKHKGKPNNQNRQRQKEAAQKFRLPEVAKSGHTREHQRQEAVSKQAQAVKAQKTLKIPWPAPRQPTEMREEYRFLNPYNFVRYLPEPTIPANDPDAQLLGRCAPPPHDRYIGLTGRIVCTLEAVTPLFISDSHDINVTTILLDDREVQHKSYRFFQYEGRDAIPATGLRGMIRSLFEAVTNSPFSVFNSDERLEYRIDPAEARRFKPGIVQSLPNGDQPGVILLCEEAKIGAYYDNPQDNVLHGSWRCGEEAYAIVGTTKNNVPKVEVINRNRDRLPKGDHRVYHGWVKVTGRTIDTKRNESFFYFKGNPDKAERVFFDAEREADFNAILHAQLYERREDFRSRIQSERLAADNLVYVELEPDDKTRVRHIALTKVARLRYRQTVGQLLPAHLHPSQQYDQLDIASRVFGWVRDTSTEDKRERIAYAGRVRFSHAVLTEDGDKGVYDGEMPLAILGSPKPTTTLFYLRKRKGEWSEAERKQPGAATTIGYDGPNILRGRKFYRHHGKALNRLEYERAGRRQDHQNRTVRGVRAPGNVFEFTIDFHNLAPVELGALLWTLNLSDLSDNEQCFFRLGYAKPLGFGSVRLSVVQVELLDPGTRYRSLQTSGWRTATFSERSRWLERFATAMRRCYGKPLYELPNIVDLIKLLRGPEKGQPQHIHYPRTNLQPDPDGKNFEWFVANKAKSTKVDQAGPNLTLEMPDVEKGLILLEKEKKEKQT